LQERAELAQRVFTQQAILAKHQRGPLHLDDAGREMVVPEKCEFLAERVAAVQHAIEPPIAQLVAAIVLGDSNLADVDQCLPQIRGLWLSVEQKVERGIGSEPLRFKQVGTAGAERGATVKMRGPFAIPR